MKTKPFSSFGVSDTSQKEVDVDENVIDEPTIVVEKYEPHLKSHGKIWYWPGHGHHCSKDECKVNKDPKSLNPIFDAIDRNEYY